MRPRQQKRPEPSMPQYPDQPPATKPHKPLWRRTWFIVVAGVVLLAIAIQALGGGGDSADQQAAETPTAQVTDPQPAPTTEAPEPEAPAEPEGPDLGTRFMQAIEEGSPAGLPTWALPITGVETMNSFTIRVFYQEPSMTQAEAEAVGRSMFTFTLGAVGDELDMIVIQDANGIDHNVSKSKVL